MITYMNMNAQKLLSLWLEVEDGRAAPCRILGFRTYKLLHCLYYYYCTQYSHSFLVLFWIFQSRCLLHTLSYYFYYVFICPLCKYRKKYLFVSNENLKTNQFKHTRSKDEQKCVSFIYCISELAKLRLRNKSSRIACFSTDFVFYVV